MHKFRKSFIIGYHSYAANFIYLIKSIESYIKTTKASKQAHWIQTYFHFFCRVKSIPLKENTKSRKITLNPLWDTEKWLNHNGGLSSKLDISKVEQYIYFIYDLRWNVMRIIRIRKICCLVCLWLIIISDD